MANTAQSAPVD